MFNAVGEGYLCLLKRVLFLSIRRLYFIQFLREICMEKRLRSFWVHFFGRPYRSNGTKILLDAALASLPVGIGSIKEPGAFLL